MAPAQHGNKCLLFQSALHQLQCNHDQYPTCWPNTQWHDTSLPHLASEMYKEQVRNNWPGLAREAEDICDQLGIKDVNVTALSKSQYSKVVDAAILYKEDEAMKSETSESKKMRVICKRHCKLARQSQSQNCATFTSNIWSLLWINYHSVVSLYT